MKTIAALIAGLLLSMTTFVAGIVIALTYLDVGKEPARAQNLDTSALWTTEPASVEKQTLSFERVPARPVPKEREVASLNKDSAGPKLNDSVANIEPVADDPMDVVDPVTTGAIEATKADVKPAPRVEQNMAHVEWCSRRYRSYRAEDNSYRPYGGGRRTCESPYSDTAAPSVVSDDALAAPNETQEARNNAEPFEDEGKVEQVIYEDAPGTTISDDHIQSCMSRYRSYRPEDNTYQPFDGGPRQQCE
jgi:hypothetical protein